MATVKIDLVQLKRDSSSNWSTKNPILAAGELGYDYTQKLSKIGDGVTPWNSLDYLRGSTSALIETVIATQDSYPDNYIEVQYTSDGLVSRVDQWDTTSKGTLIFSKVYSYDSSDRVTSEVITRATSGSRLTKTLGYNSSDQIATVTRKFEA